MDQLTVNTKARKIMTCTLYGYVTTVDVMLDQLRVMLSSPMPPRPAPMKLTVWLRLANQHSGARDATKGKRYSGRNCQTNVARSRIQNVLDAESAGECKCF